MSENSTYTELLVRYIDGELEGTELEAVKKSMSENPALLEEMENLQAAREAVKSYGLKSSIHHIHGEMMQDLNSKMPPKTGVTRRMFPPGLRVAATVIVLAAVSALYQYMLATPEKLFTENFKTFTLGETRGGSYNAMEDAYKKGNADAVIQQFQELKNPTAEDYFLAGNAYLVSRNPEKAIECFTAIRQTNKTANTHAFEEDAEYYLALSYLADRQPAMALPLFEKIHADSQHPFHSKASSWFLTRLRHTVKN